MKHIKSGCDQSCFMCRVCLPEWAPAIMANRRNINYRKGELIFKEGDLVDGMYFVYEGTVKVHKQWGADKELIVRIAGKGDILGHRGIGADTIYPVSGTALEPVTVCFIDLEFFMTSLKVNNEFLYQLMMFFAAELKVSERKMRNLAHMSVKGRLAQALITLNNKFGVDSSGAINITLSRQDLASYVGTTYETIFRTINEMTEEKILTLKGKNILIADEERLMELLGENGS